MSYLALTWLRTYAQTAIQNIIAPTFDGITSATVNGDGSITANWAAATGSAATPIKYRVYAALGASVAPATLFVGANIVGESRSTWTSLRFYQLGDQVTFLNPGSTYTVAVRAFSAENITEKNTVTVNATVTSLNYNLLASSVWDQLKSAHTIAGSFGSYLDANVSLTQTASTALTQYNNLTTAIGTLQTSATALSQYNALSTAIGLVQTAATALTQYNALVTAIGNTQQASTALTQYNNLQTALGLLQTAATALSQFNTLVSDISSSSGSVWDQLQSAHTIAGSFGSYLDAKASLTQTASAATTQYDTIVNDIAEIPTNPLLTTDTRLDDLDAPISSRLAASSYVAPDNADIAAIKAKTDNLPADPASESELEAKLAVITNLTAAGL